jgi:integral membrane protein
VAADPSTQTAPVVSPKVRAALGRYRVMAYVVGVMLLLLVAVAMPIKYIGHHDGPVAVIGTAHGFLYAIYLLAAFDLALRARWTAVGTVLVLLAGTIPFFSFVAERKVTRATRAGRRV